MAVVLITGASRGIGAHLAVGLAGDGHEVIAVSRSGDLPVGATSELAIRPLAADVTDQASISDAVDRTVTEFGGLDVAIANAGVGYFAPLEIMPATALGETIDTNLVGALRLFQAAGPHLRSSGRGRVIAMSSLAAITGLPGEAAYCASKAGLEAALESMRYELLPFGVRVSVIQPGYTEGTGLVVSGRPPEMETDSVYEPLLLANDAGHEQVRESAESPDLVLQAVRDAMASDEPAFRYPLGELGVEMTELGHAGDEEIMAAVVAVFGLQTWLDHEPESAA